MQFPRIIVAVFLFAATGLCQAQADYPAKPVRIIIPYAAGGGVDAVARAAPDGHTLLLSGGSTMTLLPLTQPRLPFNPLSDFAPIGQVSRVPFFLAVSSTLSYKTARDLFDDPKTRDGSVGYASNGVGSLRLLAVAPPQRSPFMPEVPTLAEAGYPVQRKSLCQASHFGGARPGSIVA